VEFLHFLNALAIFGISVAGTFIAARWDQMAKGGLRRAP